MVTKVKAEVHIPDSVTPLHAGANRCRHLSASYFAWSSNPKVGSMPEHNASGRAAARA
jgi:hypothetical protein